MDMSSIFVSNGTSMELTSTYSHLLAITLETIKISMNLIGFLLNCILLRLILKNHHKLHTTFSILFTYTLINDMIMSITVLLTVKRLVQCHETVVAVYYGPCTLVSRYFCKTLDSAHFFSLQNWILSQSLLILFRMAMLSARSSFISIKKTLISCLFAWIPGFITFVWLLFYSPPGPNLLASLKRCTNEDFSETTFSGFESMYYSPLPVIIALLLFPNIPYYILFFFFNRKQHRDMHKGTLSSRTLRMYATLRKISNAKAFLPLLLLADVLIFCLCQMQFLPITLSEYFTGTITSSISILNPMIAICCFRPYQRKCREFYHKLKVTIPTSLGTSKPQSQSEEVHL